MRWPNLIQEQELILKFRQSRHKDAISSHNLPVHRLKISRPSEKETPIQGRNHCVRPLFCGVLNGGQAGMGTVLSVELL